MISRRDFLKFVPTIIATGLIKAQKPINLSAASTNSTRNYGGPNLSGWAKTLGDSKYKRPPEPAVSLQDIATTHASTYSELQANLKKRIIMAHNITYKKIVDANAFNYIHTCSYQFRLPYQPSKDVNATQNGETIEGGIFIWDGPKTRLDYGIAFQWLVNPWLPNEIKPQTKQGDLRTWTGTKWVKVGAIAVDTKWHTLKMVVDFRRKATSLSIDGIQFLTQYSKTTKPDTWGNTIDARFQAEAVSIYPEPNGLKATHKAQFRNWTWQWEPAACPG